MLPIEGLICNVSITFKSACPSKLCPGESTDGCVEITRFTGIEVPSVSEEIPFNGSDKSALRLFEVDVGEFHSRIGDERASQTLLEILEISSSSKVRKR